MSDGSSKGPVKQDKGNNKIIAGGLIIIIAVAAVAIYLSKQKEKPSPTYPQQVSRKQIRKRAHFPKTPIKSANKITPKKFSVPPPETSRYSRKLPRYVNEYLKRYEQTVQTNNWKELAKWAYSKGLLVEAYQALLNTDTHLYNFPFHRRSFLVFKSEDEKFILISQSEFEKRYAKKSNTPLTQLNKLKNELNNKTFGKGISSQVYLATLLIQVDTPRGRQLYQEYIKIPGFYQILARELRRRFLTDCEDKVWQARWYDCGPMNLWLMEQLIQLDVSKVKMLGTKSIKSTHRKKRRRQGPPPGAYPEPGPTPGPEFGFQYPSRGRRRVSISQKEQLIFDHKTLIMKLLARRGGIVSSYLIAKLINTDKDQIIYKGIQNGIFDSSILARYTGIYSNLLVPAFRTLISKHQSSQTEWETIAEILSYMHNPQATYIILSSANKKGFILSRKIIENILVDGDEYVLRTIVPFIEAKKTKHFNIEQLFFTWATPAKSEMSIWKLLGLGTNKRKRQKQTRKYYEQPGMPYPEPPRRRYSHRRTPKTQTKTPERGWPVEYTINKSFDKDDIILFLKRIGRIKGEQKQTKSTKRKHYYPHQYSQDTSLDINALKKSALRCLISIKGAKISNYYRSLINDTTVGELARLGLCILNDKKSCPLLLQHFWKHPFEISKLIEEKTKSTSAGNIPEIVKVLPGKISVPLGTGGLARCGVSAREALIYFDYAEAGEAFISALGEFIVRREPYDNPALIASAACQIIEAIGRWKPPDSIRTLADLIASASDFGLRGKIRTRSGKANIMLATMVRAKALDVLGKIGDKEAINIILQLAQYEREDAYLAVAAKIALAKRGVSEAADLLVTTLDPKYQPPYSKKTNISQIIQQINPSLKSEADIALLGLSKIQLQPYLVGKVFKIIDTLGQPAEKTKPNYKLQEKIILSLLSKEQPEVMSKLIEMLQQDDKKYYWNNLDQKEEDLALANLLRILYQKPKHPHPDQVVEFVKTILLRKEKLIIKNANITNWKPEQYLATLTGQISLGRQAPIYIQPSLPKIRKGHLPLELSETDIIALPSKRKRRKKFKISNVSATAIVPIKFNFFIDSLNLSPQNEEESSSQTDKLAIKILKQLPHPIENLKKMNSLSFYKFICAYEAYKTSPSPQAQSNLVNIMKKWSSKPQEQALIFLGLENLAKTSDFKLIAPIGKAYSSASKEILRRKLLDIALYLAINTLESQLTGKTRILNTPSALESNILPWENAVENALYTDETDEFMVILFSIHSRFTKCIDWMDKIVESQYKNNQPVSEKAITTTIDILSKINPSGNDSLLNFYYNILTYKKEEKEEKKEKRTQQIGQRTRTKTKIIIQEYLYSSSAPMVITSIGNLKGIDRIKALKKVISIRPDLMGLASVEIYKINTEEGKKYIKQTISSCKKLPILIPQAEIILDYLITHPSKFSKEMIVKSIVKGPSALAQGTIQLLSKRYETKSLPKNIDIITLTVQILQKLSTYTTRNQETTSTMEKAIAFAKSLNNPELKRLVEKIEKQLERKKQRRHRTTRRRKR